ncbi:MAG: hypothetical protein KGQ60_00190 [Planctomycetes bacterium]|nr:hypothetical protein [Planctomycetota bacterium]
MNEIVEKGIGSFYFGKPAWIPWVLAAAALLAVITILSYRRSTMPMWAKLSAVLFRLFGIALLLLCLLEPMGSIERAKPQSNAFAVAVDNSQSTKENWIAIGREKNESTPDQWYRELLKDESSWIRKLSDEFRLRRYVIDDSINAIDSFEGIQQTGTQSEIVHSLNALRERYSSTDPSGGQANIATPLAGIILFSDGQATDKQLLDRLKGFPIPVYPVSGGEADALKDLFVQNVSARQSDFETAPVTMTATLSHRGYENQNVVVELQDATKKVLESKQISMKKELQPVSVEFRFRPANPGIQGYRVVVKDPKGDANPSEWTPVNNHRFQVVDRGRGPYQILYIAGRPNWEYKFLTRALSEDDELRLTGLIRIAKKEPKFSFRDNKVDSSNPLFSGFDDILDEEKEQYNEPVFVRLGVTEEGQLKKGFPKDSEELYAYQAIIIDDVEDSFFTREQQSMLRQFVTVRGGGLLALGGQESMRGEGFRDSVLSQLLPVYSDDETVGSSGMTADPDSEPIQSIRMQLSRDGWLQPFMRLADSEAGEKKRLEAMPGFQVWNRVKDIKPGAAVLAQTTSEEDPQPLLVTQRFGRGRTSALLVGDWWRWAMHREGNDPSPLYQAWRQLIRWLITDVPKSIALKAEPVDGSYRMQKLIAEVRGTDFQVIDNASVAITIFKPDGSTTLANAEASSEIPGRYELMALSDQEGVYSAVAKCSAPDGSEIGNAQVGWVHEPLAKEFLSVGEDKSFLEEVAEKTGGRVLSIDELESFASNVPATKNSIKERRVFPLWHKSWVIGLALASLCIEWGWRRRYGMS